MRIPIHVDTLIFDLGGVIYDIDIQRGINNFKKLGFDKADEFIGHYIHADFVIGWEKGTVDWITFKNEIKKRSSKNISDEEIENAWGSILIGIPDDRIKLLQVLKKKYKILMLSNTNPYHIETCLAKELAKRSLTTNDLFDKCYYSYKIGHAKPSEKIFIYLLNDANVKATNCLFLDDGQTNIEVANSLGFNTYLVNPGQNLDFLLI